MKVSFKFLLTAFIAASVFVSCDPKTGEENEWDGVTSKVSVTASIGDNDIDISKLDGVTVSFIDTRTQMVTTGTFDAAGNSSVSVSVGVYNIVVESEIDASQDIPVRYCAAAENQSITESTQELEIDIKAYPASANNNGFIISEYFFNGETNDGRMMHPDQYIVIYNSSLVTQYADGLTFGTTIQASISDPYPFLAETIDNSTIAMGYITVPGSGTDYPIAPGEKFVIAMSAMDHYKASGVNSVDLSGADFEYYEGPESDDIDNPAVPNMIATTSIWEGGGGSLMHPKGFYAGFIVKLEDGTEETIREFYDDNSWFYKFPDTVDEETGETIPGAEYTLQRIPNEKILDGIVSGQNYIITRPLSESIDRGEFIVPGCHSQKLAIRKTIEIDGVLYYQDTNNSNDDLIMQDGQNAYPVGWRNIVK